MSYQVLARKWRPANFEQMVGQDHVLRALVNAFEQQRLHHAYLLTGTRGVGKTTLGRILAKCLNCEAGVSAHPCGQCRACQEIDAGRFVDLIEVDAASRTGVDDTRELLDNVQYAPSSGRYKIYLIDEVHMLSGHSFNALLKTLEEPPPHVKFLLATTDPQKLPVTVLSRCLQFNLKRLPAGLIAGHLKHVLEREGVDSDPAALEALAQAADGSMRDALSLLDQAIAFGNGEVRAGDVSEMLGWAPREHMTALAGALAARDGRAMLDATGALADQGVDLEGVLQELTRALYRAAVLQQWPELSGEAGVEDEVARVFAGRLSPEDIQLYYQIALQGRRDLPWAADSRSGLEMTLLRMLVFRPFDETEGTREYAGSGGRVSPPSVGEAPVAAPVPASRATPVAAAPPAVDRGRGPDATPPDAVADGKDWGSLLGRLGLRGVAQALASNCSLAEITDNGVRLVLDERHAGLRTRGSEQRLQEALSRHLGREVRLRIDTGKHALATPAQQDQQARDARQQGAERSIETDRVVRDLKEQLGARVVPDSIEPLGEP